MLFYSLTRQSFDYFTILDFSIAEVSKYTLDNRKGEIEIVSVATVKYIKRSERQKRISRERILVLKTIE